MPEVIMNEEGCTIHLTNEEMNLFFERMNEWIEIEHNAAEGVSDDDTAHYMIEDMIQKYNE